MAAFTMMTTNIQYLHIIGPQLTRYNRRQSADPKRTLVPGSAISASQI